MLLLAGPSGTGTFIVTVAFITVVVTLYNLTTVIFSFLTLNQLMCEGVEFVKDSLVPADLNVCKLHPWKRVVKTQQLLSLAWDTWCVVRHVISPEVPPSPRPALCHALYEAWFSGNRNTFKRLLGWLWSETLATIRSESSRLFTHVKKHDMFDDHMKASDSWLFCPPFMWTEWRFLWWL